MNVVFFAVAAAMLVVALAVVVLPLARTYRGDGRAVSRLPVFTVAAAIASTIALYTAIGRPDALAAVASPAVAAHEPARAAGGASSAGAIADLVGGLEARLESNPGDAGGWLLLAKSYDHLGEPDNAREAYARAAALGGADPAFEEKLASATGVSMIRGRVVLDPDARSLVNAGDVVFVLARPPDGSGMPLAVIRRPAADIPFEFALGDAQSMGSVSLSGHDEVELSARISPSGEALDLRPGVAARAGPVPTRGAQPVRLEIGVTGAEDRR